MYLVLDTSILIDIERAYIGTIEKIRELKKTYPAPAKISFISYFEFIVGLKEKSEKNKEKSSAFIEKFDMMQTNKSTANYLAHLKNAYELPLADLFIAAQTIENNAILVTKDKDFEQITELNKIIL
ncbi:MAG: type II toxin-antitoxin system VapC family toxin [Nanoarchaeota archaeon]